jgi:hypothetical protein
MYADAANFCSQGLIESERPGRQLHHHQRRGMGTRHQSAQNADHIVLSRNDMSVTDENISYSLRGVNLGLF